MHVCVCARACVCVCVCVCVCPQAPSLLISLINMFLEFGESPKVIPNGTLDDNEYSAFGPSVNAANGQVSYLIHMTISIVSV